jgi:DNA polymerase-3 subunit delta
MRANPDQLKRQLAKGVGPAYLIAGAEPLLVQEAVDQVRAAALTQGVGERLVHDLQAGFDWPAFVMESRSMGLFSTRRLIELRLPNAKLTVEGAAALTSILADPGPDTLLVQMPEWSRAIEKLPWVEAFDRHGVVLGLWPVKAEALPAWIRERAAALGVRLGEDAVQELAARTEGNLLAASQELRKLALLAGGAPLDAATLVDLVGDHARFDVYALFDAVLARQPLRLREVLGALAAEGYEPAEAAAHAVSQVFLLANAQALRERGQLSRHYWFEARVPAHRQPVYERALDRDWSRALAEASAVDRAVKGRSADPPWLALERWLLRAASGGGQSRRFAA